MAVRVDLGGGVEAHAARSLVAEIGNTPVVEVMVRTRSGSIRPLHLKLEGANPGGSIKDRVARSLIQNVLQSGVHNPRIVESTSGNLGVGLAMVCRAEGLPFTAVVDNKATAENIDKLRRFGADIEVVTPQKHDHNHVQLRIERVKQLLQTDESFVWTNQYSNEANPATHERNTAPELFAQMNKDVDAVFVAASTGGTLAGIGRHFRQHSSATRVVAVDVVNSLIFTDQGGPRASVGIGSNRKSDFLSRSLYDDLALMTDIESFATAISLRQSTGISVGGSSGAVIAAAIRYADYVDGRQRLVCVCPDTGANYEKTFFDVGWLHQNGFDKMTIPSGVFVR